MLVGAAEPAAINDSAASQHSWLKSERRRRGCRIRIGGHPTPSPAHSAGVGQPRLPRRQISRRSQREEPMSDGLLRSSAGNLACTASTETVAMTAACCPLLALTQTTATWH